MMALLFGLKLELIPTVPVNKEEKYSNNQCTQKNVLTAVLLKFTFVRRIYLLRVNIIFIFHFHVIDVT